MKNKDFREIQVSSSLLVVIFLGVLALGVFIFLLGVSVGKKQVRLTAPDPDRDPADRRAGQGTAGLAPSPADTESAAVAPVSGEPAPKSAPPAATVKTARREGRRPKRGRRPRRRRRRRPASITSRSARSPNGPRPRRRPTGTRSRATRPSWPTPRPSDTKTWYRVRLGGYASRDRAARPPDQAERRRRQEDRFPGRPGLTHPNPTEEK